MKNSKWLALLLVFVLVSALVPSALAADYVEPFTDVPVKQYYAEPVSWAVAQEITNGVSKTEFAPGKTCTRAEAVTFLYRYYHLAEPGYVLMNIPYADFYAAEGTSDVDAVTSATLSKTRTATLAGGSYHKDPKGTDISGVVYPVYVADLKLLDGLKEVKDTDTVTISVTNRGTTTETTFTGKDALFENEDYAYYKLDSAPNAYKTLTKDREGKLVFSAVNAQAKKVDMTAAVTYGGHHTDVTYKVTCDALPQSGITVNGVVITAGGTQYALRHVYEIWRVTELGWNWDQLDGSGLSGKTITNITYYITNADGEYEVLTCDVNDALKLKPAEITAAFVDANTIAVSGIPADAKNVQVTVKDQVGRGETATVFAENAAVQDGKVLLTMPAVEGKSYVVSFVSDNYADSSVTIPFGTVE